MPESMDSRVTRLETQIEILKEIKEKQGIIEAEVRDINTKLDRQKGYIAGAMSVIVVIWSALLSVVAVIWDKAVDHIGSLWP